jgi:hypothetical protein
LAASAKHQWRVGLLKLPAPLTIQRMSVYVLGAVRHGRRSLAGLRWHNRTCSSSLCIHNQIERHVGGRRSTQRCLDRVARLPLIPDVVCQGLLSPLPCILLHNTPLTLLPWAMAADNIDSAPTRMRTDGPEENPSEGAICPGRSEELGAGSYGGPCSSGLQSAALLSGRSRTYSWGRARGEHTSRI